MAKGNKDSTNDMSNIIEGGGTAETIVGHSVKIEGDLISDGDIKVDGSVSGKIKTAKSLFVGPTAKIEADVEAGTVTVAGVVHGNLKVKGLLVILQTGKILGDIECGQLAIEEGAFLQVIVRWRKVKKQKK